MKTFEVQAEQWGRFCKRVTELHRGALISIRIEQPDASHRVVVADEPLRALVLDNQSDACNNILVIETGMPGQKGEQHRIVEPMHIRLKHGPDNRYNEMNILAESGTTVLTLHPGLNAESIGEFASGHLSLRE